LWLFGVPGTTGIAQEITSVLFSEDSQVLIIQR